MRYRDGDRPLESGAVFIRVTGPTVYLSVRDPSGACAYIRGVPPTMTDQGWFDWDGFAYATDSRCAPAGGQRYGPPPFDPNVWGGW